MGTRGTKLALIVVALVTWKLMGRSFAEMGWRGADRFSRTYVPWFVLAGVSMMAGSAWDKSGAATRTTAVPCR